MATSENRAGKRRAQRQRKYHRKSRLGCQNCKFRSIKCDEGKPVCNRCNSSGFTCTYASDSSSPSSSSSSEPALELAHAGAFRVHLDKPAPTEMVIELPPPNPRVRLPVTSPLATGANHYELSPHDFLALDDFHKHVVHTLGSGFLRATTKMDVKTLGVQHPYLLHSYLTVGHIYQQNLAVAHGNLRSTRCRAALAFHWYQASVLHNQTLLATGHTSSGKDAIMVAATLLKSAAFGYLDSHESKEHWPNKVTEGGDLHWLRLSMGKKAVWTLADPTREDSMFRSIVHDVGISNPPLPNAPIPPGTFPPVFMSLYGFDETSTFDNNPFFSAASVIAQLLPERCNGDYILRFLAFPREVTDAFCGLLASKDPRALLLLCWWWAKACVYEGWWLSRRATVEGRAICLYLENNFATDPRIMELLEFPRAVLGLLNHSVPQAVERSTYLSEPELMSAQ